ncbi:MAG: D-alanyl-D-alanine carboxypeptidase/D-alanyl-D-alanine-endopeptidase [Candidatus Cyclonatronum sp.]|uniref:D-alanyl-D-alanine carboxypeptidase/D-alanyl-D-alanine endopeptidase n=1 Tax=Cyclonatronum sp. TaxID=3024185 RepID=UPI0025C0E0A0|nr:D-alanyl-D-alanine carboxypeptidase/D-alanyl-D-alanine-endopeptidase [Cyclonatronum sp.]MCH8486085.1 D-alanyl-D-alanine carboxypeptidase/D-alanyl-D-alanine-endopeptidase [Cyclonatronum sp.]
MTSEAASAGSARISARMLFWGMMCVLFVPWLWAGGTAKGFAAGADGRQPAPVHAAAAPSEERIQALIAAGVPSDAVWAVSVRNEAGEELISINSSTPMRMASNSKLFVTAGLLHGLGPDFRFRTTLYGDGRLVDGVWLGDVHLAGSGDPSIDKYHYDNDAMFVFNSFIRQLREQGINRIVGDVFGNESLFDDIRYPRGWEWDDLSYYYAPETGALSFNRNCIDLTVRAVGTVGDQPQITWFPFNTDYVNLVNEQRITPRNVRFNESYARVLGTNTILLRSTLPQGYLEKESLTITDPALFFIDSFVKQASFSGIDWIGELIVDSQRRNWRGFRNLAEHHSEPLAVLLKRVNAHSDNFYTEMLTKALGAYSMGVQGSTEAGLTLILEELEKIGLDTTDLRFRDASGMASANLASAYQITALLRLMQQSPYRTEWEQTFAKAGFSGTLENRFISSPALGNLYAKTGFITGVRTLSGYLDTQSGTRLSFSILTNNFTSRVAAVDQVHERILNLLWQEL